MQKKPFHYKKLFLVIIGLILTFWVTEWSYNPFWTQLSDNSTAKQMGEIYRTGLEKGEKAYADGSAWYKKTNTTVTILPYILEMGMLDFVEVFFLICFVFWLFIRYFMR